jgi:mannose-6-phosphate isomerase-like protein (cupin superfamily)
MLKIDLEERAEFVAGDRTVLREVLHPAKDGVRLGYSLAHAFVRPGEESLPHRLASSEVYCFLEGRGVMSVDGEEAEVGPGTTVYVPPGGLQHVRNTGQGDLRFLCIVDPAWKVEDEQVL